MTKSSKPLLNSTELTESEIGILSMVRTMQLYDKVEIKYSKRGEIQWQLTQSKRGVYNILDQD